MVYGLRLSMRKGMALFLCECAVHLQWMRDRFYLWSNIRARQRAENALRHTHASSLSSWRDERINARLRTPTFWILGTGEQHLASEYTFTEFPRYLYRFENHWCAKNKGMHHLSPFAKTTERWSGYRIAPNTIHSFGDCQNHVSTKHRKVEWKKNQTKAMCVWWNLTCANSSFFTQHPIR